MRCPADRSSAVPVQGRILVLKDGKIFTETRKGRKTRREFFIEILDILTLLGGDTGNVV